MIRVNNGAGIKIIVPVSKSVKKRGRPGAGPVLQ
jgi:hypothetical protein